MVKKHIFPIFIKPKGMGDQKDGKQVWLHAQFCKNAYGKFSNEKNVTQNVLHSLVFSKF